LFPPILLLLLLLLIMAAGPGFSILVLMDILLFYFSMY